MAHTLKTLSSPKGFFFFWSVGQLRFITPVGPEELTLQALSPEERGYRVSIHRQA